MKHIRHQSRVEPIAARRAPAARGGATIVETAIVLGVFLLILLASLDLGLAVLRRNTLSEAARRLARSASLHGVRAAPERTVWGPAPYVGTAGDGSEYADAVDDILVTMNEADVSLSVVWLDGDNRTGDRVRAQLEMTHRTIVPGLFGPGGLRLRSASVMRIEH